MNVLRASVLLTLVVCSIGTAEPPRNVIFFIGDGMGPEQVEAAQIYTGGLMSFSDPSQFPFTANCTTYSADSSVTDSAAAATALATSVKVNNGVISMAYPGDGSELLTLLEDARDQGKATGLVTTTYLTHATPAGFGAHEPSRNNYTAIASDYLNQTHPNVLFGGGANGLTVSSTEAAGYTVVVDTAGFSGIDPLTGAYFSAQFGSSYMPYKEDYLGSTYPYPTLDAMTAKAISVLSQNPNGFFLMVEGGMIDQACHSNWIKECVHEVIDLSNAVQEGYNWASGRGDTLVFVTADHETGGLTVTPGNVDGEGYPVPSWTTTGHTGTNVGVFAWGVNAGLVGGTMDNTDMFNVCTADTAPVLEATNPWPHDGQTGVPVDTTLTWTPGTGAAHHWITVWTGVEPDVTIVVDEYISAAEQAVACGPDTTYYWKVDEYDSADVLIAAGQTWSFTTIGLPTAPTNLSPAGGIVPLNVELSWTASENAEQYLVYLGTSPDVMPLASTQTGTSYAPLNLTYNATYYWKVVARNSAGEASSGVVSFTTEDLPQPEAKYAQAENTVLGVHISGGLASLYSNTDNDYEVLQEALNVPNKNGYSALEHVWTFDIGNAVSAEFYVEAYKTASADGDDFVFSWSADGITYTDMLTVTSIEDTDVSQFYAFPLSPTGTVYVRVTDTDHTRANQFMDTLYVDQMYIYASEGSVIKHYKASEPVPADGSVDVGLDQILSWTPGDDAVLHRVWFGDGGPDELIGPFEGSAAMFDPAVWEAAKPGEITPGTVYFWRVDELREDGGSTTGDVWNYTTVQGACTPTNMLVDSVVTTLEAGPRGTSYGVATVTIVDNCGNVVVGAEVTGSFTGDFSGDTGLTATTNENGAAVFRSSTAVKKPTFGFEVTNVVDPTGGLTW